MFFLSMRGFSMSYLTSQDKMRYIMTHLQGELGERVFKEIRSHRTPNDASKKAAQEIRKRIIAATKK